MEGVYVLLFVAFAVPAAVLEYTENACFGLAARRAPAAKQQQQQQYLRFRNNYVLIFSLMMAGDWLQGPYVYHLYEHYQYSVKDIGRLFIMGFGSSAVFGTIAGAMADRRGRKRAALLYVATYVASCLTKHSPNFWVLLLGRLLGGIATSLLFSAFESWAVAAHSAAGYEQRLLADLFTKAVFLGNGLMAIGSGLLGNLLVEGLGLGPVAPFDAAAAVLLAGGAAIHVSWTENYGDRGAGDLGGQFRHALTTIWNDPRVALLGASQALFEASMYTFVFLWTPALSPGGQVLPHGFIFAIFMTASMVGTALVGKLLGHCQLERLMQGVFWCSAASLFVPAVFHLQRHEQATMQAAALLLVPDEYERLNFSSTATPPPAVAAAAAAAAAAAGQDKQQHARLLVSAAAPHGSSASAPQRAAASGDPGLGAAGVVQLVAFCVFEVMIGMFWPSMMTLRAKYVPEEQRSTIINVFRIPLNVFVCVILWKVSDFPLGVIFSLCSLFLVAAAGCQHQLDRITGGLKAHPSDQLAGEAAAVAPGAGEPPGFVAVACNGGSGELLLPLSEDGRWQQRGSSAVARPPSRQQQ